MDELMFCKEGILIIKCGDVEIWTCAEDIKKEDIKKYCEG